MTDKFSRYFNEVTYYPWQEFQPEYLETDLPDVLVYEVVERDISRLLSDMDLLLQVNPETAVQEYAPSDGTVLSAGYDFVCCYLWPVFGIFVSEQTSFLTEKQVNGYNSFTGL